MSFFQGEVMGTFADEQGNIVLGKCKDKTLENVYVMYRESDLKQKPAFDCESPAIPVPVTPNPNNQGMSTPPPVSGTYVGCPIDMYVEVDFALYNFNGANMTNTLNYVTNLFNNISALYDVESIVLQVSQVYVYTSADPFVSYNTTSSMLNAFSAHMDNTSYTGDLAHLLSGRNVGGGIAWLDVLCASNYYKCGLTCNMNGFGALPAYSWESNAVTHEIGHNLGSNHTQWCGWLGGAIDNCYQTEGGCPVGPAPVNGGTIMSYCHLASYGVNLANGFGPQPGNAIRTGVANAMCACTNTCGLTVGINVSNASCGNANGGATATPNGGTAPYTYTWSNGSSASALTNANMGPYTLLVTDNNGCIIGANVNIGVNSGTTTLSSCTNSFADGSGPNDYTDNMDCRWLIQPAGASTITLNFTSFDTELDYDFVYVYDGATTTSPLLGQYSGNTLPPTLTSSGGVMLVRFTSDVYVTETGWTATYNTHYNINQQVTICSGQSFTINGNTYTSSGSYTNNLNTVAGCDSTVVTQLTVLNPISATLSQTNVSCFGGNNGTATLSNLSGGAGGYTYSWSNGQTSQTATNLAAGTYSVQVTDANNCTVSQSVTVSSPAALVALASATNTACFGGGNGTATVSVTGGTPNYLYSWSDGQTSQTAANLSAGTYSVQVTDANNCTTSQSVTVSEPPQITFNQNVMICEGDSFVVGNSVYYNAGTFTDHLTTSIGCDSIVTTTIKMCVGIDGTLIGDIRLYPNPVNGNNLYLNMSNIQPGRWEFELVNALGQMLMLMLESVEVQSPDYVRQWERSQYALGVYFFRIKDEQGKSKTWKVIRD